MTYIFHGEIRNFDHLEKVDQLIDLFISKIFSLDFLIKTEDQHIRLPIFKEKLRRCITASIKDLSNAGNSYLYINLIFILEHFIALLTD